MQQKTPEQERQRWESLVSRRLGEGVPEEKVVEELVGRGADLHLARDFVRRTAEKQPQPEAKPEVQAAGPSSKHETPIDAVIGIVLAAVGLVAAISLYAMDTRSWGVYAGYAAAVVGIVLIARRALASRS